MVEAVGTVSMQVAAAKTTARSSASATVTSSGASSSSGDTFVSSAIRVDNLQNVAILEYRSSDGEVVQQYPTQTQIDAFTRARALERKELFSTAQPQAAAAGSAAGEGSSSSEAAPPAVTTQAAAPQPAETGASIEV